MKNENPIKWADLWALVKELGKVNKLISDQKFEKALSAFNNNVLNMDNLDHFDLKSIQSVLENEYITLLRVYNAYKKLPHKGGLELGDELGSGVVKLFTRLGR